MIQGAKAEAARAAAAQAAAQEQAAEEQTGVETGNEGAVAGDFNPESAPIVYAAPTEYVAPVSQTEAAGDDGW